jgi:uncharacterized membrane protein required for colicin V production
MTIWLLALLLIASVAAMGFRQGGIRAGFSLFGILLGAMLAIPLGRWLKPVLAVVGFKNPTLVWMLAPFIVFVVISIIFKVVALTVHQKVDVHYKYRAGDLKLALWERLNHRLGLCLGLVNGAMYVILIAWIIYAFSYWTVQMAAADDDPTSVRMLNRLGRDLHSTGFAKVAASIDSLPQSYYDAADLVGVLYNNPLAEARLTRYPALLALAERPEIQDIATDQYFTEMRQKHEPIMNVINYAKVQAVLKNPDLVHTIWTTLAPDLKELPIFLETGKSAKYDGEKILGRWHFDVNSAINAVRRAKPNMASLEMQKVKKWMVAAFSKTSLVAAADHQAFLKNVPKILAATAAPTVETQTLEGKWSEAGGKYQMSFAGAGKEAAVGVEGDRLTMSSDGMEMVFSREN